MAKLYESEGQLTSARTHYRQAIERVEQVRANLAIADEKAGFLADKIQVYKDLIALLVRMHRNDPGGGYDAEAFRYVERSRARASLDLLAEAENKIESDSEPSALERQREIEGRVSHLRRQLTGFYAEGHRDRAKIATIAQELESADEEFRSLRRQLHEENPRYAAFRYPEAIDLQQTQELLPEVPCFSNTRWARRSHSCSQLRDMTTCWRACPASQLSSRIRTFRSRGGG